MLEHDRRRDVALLLVDLHRRQPAAHEGDHAVLVLVDGRFVGGENDRLQVVVAVVGDHLAELLDLGDRGERLDAGKGVDRSGGERRDVVLEAHVDQLHVVLGEAGLGQDLVQEHGVGRRAGLRADLLALEILDRVDARLETGNDGERLRAIERKADRLQLALGGADHERCRADHADVDAAGDHGVARGLAAVEGMNGDVAAGLFEQVFRTGDHADRAPGRVLVAEIDLRPLRICAQAGCRGDKGAAGESQKVASWQGQLGHDVLPLNFRCFPSVSSR